MGDDIGAVFRADGEAWSRRVLQNGGEGGGAFGGIMDALQATAGQPHQPPCPAD